MTSPTPSEVLADELDAFDFEGWDISPRVLREFSGLLVRVTAALRARPPEGMVLVPREPTDAMCLAGLAKVDKGLVDYGVDNVYRAMLAAVSSGGKE